MKQRLKGFYRLSVENMPARISTYVEFIKSNHYLPNISQPKTFNEKVLWRKLYDKNPLYSILLDKLRAKDMVSRVIGEQYVIPVMWMGSDPYAMPFSELELPFVVKANHGSNFNLFCINHEDVNISLIHKKCSLWLRTDYSKFHREWAYSQIEPKIFVEPFVGSMVKFPNDYRVWVFNGKAVFVNVASGKSEGHLTSTFYDVDWNQVPFRRPYWPTQRHQPPESLTEMIDIAERLALGLDFIRVDFYETNGRPLFGEFTLYPGAGLDRFIPSRFDRIFGDLWKMRN